jgi:catechol 2,3-dioxygenase-like lactoylglutathione lyase family enzyme
MQTTLPADAGSDTSPLRVTELNHVAIHVRDLQSSIRFYGETLGLPVLPRPDFGFDGAWFALGSQELHLIIDNEHRDDPATRYTSPYQSRTPMRPTRTGQTRRTDRQQTRPRPDGAVQVFFRDPDGYLIEMVSRG